MTISPPSVDKRWPFTTAKNSLSLFLTHLFAPIFLLSPFLFTRINSILPPFFNGDLLQVRRRRNKTVQVPRIPVSLPLFFPAIVISYDAFTFSFRNCYKNRLKHKTNTHALSLRKCPSHTTDLLKFNSVTWTFCERLVICFTSGVRFWVEAIFECMWL